MKLINRNKNPKDGRSRAELYESFVDSATEGFLLFDSRLFLTAMNAAAIEIIGAEHTAKIGSDIKDLLPNMYSSNRFELLHDVIRKNQPIRWRDHTMRGDKPYAFEVAAFKSDNGLGMVVFDIDRRQEKVARLETSDELSTAIETVMHEPFLILDSENRVLSANHSFYDHFFLKAADVINESIYDLNETQWNVTDLHELLDYKISRTGSARNYTLEAYFTGLGERTLKLNAKQFLLDTENRLITLLAIEDVSEVSKQRIALKKQIELFSKVPDAVIITDVRGHIIELNDRAIGLYGWSSSELVDKPVKSVVPPELRSDFDTLLQKTFAGEDVVNYETDHWAKKGGHLHVTMNMSVLKDKNEEVYGAVLYIQHFPSLAHAKQSLEKLKTVLLQANEPVIFVDQSGVIIAFNSKAEEAYGWQQGSILGKDSRTLVFKEDHTAYEAGFAECLKGYPVKNLSIRRITRQENIREVELSFYPLNDVREEKTGTVILERFKTVNKHASQASAKLLSTFLKLPDAVITENMSGEVVDLNDAAAALYGWRRNDLIGKLARSLVPTDQQKQADDLMQKCKAGEVVKNVDSRRWSKSGEFFQVELTLFQILDFQGLPMGIVTISRQVVTPGASKTARQTFEMEMLFQESFNPIIIEDLSGKVLRMNKAAEALFGWQFSDLKGKPLKMVIPAGQHKQHDKIILLCHNDVQIQNVESKCWSKDGQVHSVSVSLIPLRNNQGEMTAIANIFQQK